MASVVPCIIEVLMNKIALWISNRKNDWRAESAMIASNVYLGLKWKYCYLCSFRKKTVLPFQLLVLSTEGMHSFDRS